MMRAAFAFALCAVGLVACGASVEAPPARPRAEPPKLAPLEGPVRACMAAAACARPEDPPALRDPSACVDLALAHGAHDGRYRCLERARNCRDVDACLSRERPDEAKRLCDSRPGAIVFCDGDRLVNCEPDATRVVNCAELRGACREFRVANGMLVRGCWSGALCPDGAAPQRCDPDGSIVTCQQGLAERTRCPAGTRCAESVGAGGEVEPRCVATGKRPCVPGALDRCDGDVLVSCLIGEEGRGTTVETDCGASGLRCEGDARGASCVAGRACAPGPARCEGNSVRFCAAGVPVNAHCDRYGWGACKSDGGGAACQSLR